MRYVFLPFMLLASSKALELNDCVKIGERRKTLEAWMEKLDYDIKLNTHHQLFVIKGNDEKVFYNEDGKQIRVIELKHSEEKEEKTNNLKKILKFAPEVIPEPLEKSVTSCFLKKNKAYFTFISEVPIMKITYLKNESLKTRFLFYKSLLSYLSQLLEKDLWFIDLEEDHVYNINGDWSQVVIPSFLALQPIINNEKATEEARVFVFSIISQVESIRYNQAIKKLKIKGEPEGPYEPFINVMTENKEGNRNVASLQNLVEYLEDLEKRLQRVNTSFMAEVNKEIKKEPVVTSKKREEKHKKIDSKSHRPSKSRLVAEYSARAAPISPTRAAPKSRKL